MAAYRIASPTSISAGGAQNHLTLAAPSGLSAKLISGTVNAVEVFAVGATGTVTAADATGLTMTPTNRQMPGGMGFGAIEFYGHSMTSYGGTFTSSRGTAARLGATLHAEVRDYSINGAGHVNHDKGVPFWHTGFGDGGWSHVFTFTEVGATAPFEAKRNAAVLFTGINDVGTMGPTNLGVPMRNALRSSISRLRAGAVFENSDASVAYGGAGTWNSTAGGTLPEKFQSGTTYHANTTTGGTVTISVPATFAGGTVAFASLCGPSGNGADWSFSVDGGAATTLVSRGVHPLDRASASMAEWSSVIKRFTGLAAGAHTIVATTTATTTAGYFDCWWIEAPTPPLVNVPKAPYTDGSGYALGKPINSDVDALNAEIATVVAEFDSFVFSSDLTALLNQTTDLSDGIHFNDQGHKKVAALYAEDFLVRSRTLLAHTTGNADPSFLTKTPAQTWNPDAGGELENRLNVIQPARPDVVPLTLRESAFGSSSASQTYPSTNYVNRKDFLRVESKTGGFVSGIDYLGGFYTGVGAATARVFSIFGTAILQLGASAVASTGNILGLSGGSSSAVSVNITSQSGQTANLLDINKYTSLRASFTSEAHLKVQNSASSWNMGSYTTVTDANPLWGVIGGTMNWGAGGATAPDVSLSRTAASELTLATGDFLKTDNPTAAQHVATKSYVDATYAPYRVVKSCTAWCNGFTVLSAVIGVFTHNGFCLAPTGQAVAAEVFYLDDADFLITGETLKLLVRGQTHTNATAPGITTTIGLYPITATAGGNNVLTYTVGTVVTGSTVAIASAASTQSQGNSGQFDHPGDGYYVLGAVGSGTQAANSSIGLTAHLLVTNV